MTDKCHHIDEDTGENVRETVARLREENQHLREQVRQQVRIEQTLVSMQRQMDEQVHLYRQLHEVGQKLVRVFDLDVLLETVTDFVLYVLNFERCVFLLYQDEAQQYQVAAQDGYYAQEDRELLSTLAIAQDDPLLVGLRKGESSLLCTALCEQEELRALGQRLGMDEFVVFGLLEGEGLLPGLLAVGNTRQQAAYQTRIDAEGQVMPALASLVNQVATLLTNVRLYAAIRQERNVLEQKVEERTRELQALQEARVRELSTPLIRLTSRVLLMPLVGQMDDQRARQVMETLLEGIAVHQAEVAILDITGVATVDSQVASGLVQTARAAALLGTQVVLSGISPVIARTLVHLGVDTGCMQTCTSLEGAVVDALA